MSSTGADQVGGVDGLESLSTGDQVLVSIDSGTNLLTLLPDRAFEELLVMAIRYRPAELEAAITDRGLDPKGVTVVPLTLDPPQYSGPMTVTQPARPGDLTGIGMVLSDWLQSLDSNAWIAVDALSIMLMYAERERLLRFFQIISNRVAGIPARGAYGVIREAVTDETYAQLTQFCDREFDLRTSE